MRNRRVVTGITLGAFCVIAAGCAGRTSQVAYDPAGFGPPDAPAPADTAARSIAPLDKVDITVFREEELSGTFQVDSSGQIDYPLLGQIEVQGRTTAEVAQLVRDRLGSRYVKDPRVQVAISEAAAQMITVEGAVGQPGVFPVDGSTTLVQAVALARGTKENANDAQVLVFRNVGGKRMAAAFDLRAIRRAQAEDPIIYGRDVIVVPDSRSRALFRDILSSIPVLGIFRPF